MNGLIFLSSLTAVFCSIGHFSIGKKLYLQPMLAATFDDVARKVMHCVFHYVSVFLVLATAVLVTAGVNGKFWFTTPGVVKFIAANFLLFAVAQMVIALTSGIKGSLFKMFQWAIFLIIAVLAWFGAA